MSNLLQPHWILFQEDFDAPYPDNLVYRAQSTNFDYVFNQGLLLKGRDPMKHVGIRRYPCAMTPHNVKPDEVHIMILSLFNQDEPECEPVTGRLADDPNEYPF
jgi:hypothetical protein